MREPPFDLLESIPRRLTKAQRLAAWLRANGAQTFAGAGCLGMLGFMLVPVFEARERNGRPYCLSNLKQIALSALMYSQDYHERLMPRERWMDSAMPYIKNESVFRCPEAVESDPIAFGYAFNGRFSMARMDRIASPASVPLFYDSENLSRNAFDHFSSLTRPGRHNGRNNIAFADGHAKPFTDSQLQNPPFRGGETSQNDVK
jgi:prepilin-type processing-associated H-X9-DG protein